jgi:hypothetical protein
LYLLDHGLGVKDENATRAGIQRQALIAHVEIMTIGRESQILREAEWNRSGGCYQLWIGPQRILDNADITVGIERVGRLIEETADPAGIQTNSVEAAAEGRVDLIGSARDERVAAIRRKHDAACVVHGQLRVASACKLVQVQRNHPLLP